MIEVIQYVVNGAMWAALFFTVGYQIGKVNRVLSQEGDEVHDLKTKIEEIHE